jgi:hypothetical protein
VILDVDACSTEAGEDVKATRAEKRAARKEDRSPKRRRGQKNATTEQVEDRGNRLGEVLDWLDAFAFGDDWIAPDVVIAESGRAMNVGSDGIISLATGIAAARFIAWKFRIPIAWATPREWRRSLVPNPADRRAGPDEKEIEAALGTATSERVKQALRGRGKSITLRGHALDAVGMGRWGLRASFTIQREMEML